MIHLMLLSVILAFEAPVDEAVLEGGGKLALSIGEVPEVSERGKPVPVTIEVSNTSSKEVEGELSIRLEPSWTLEGSARTTVKVPAGGKAAIDVKIVAGPRTHGAHYPVHARLGSLDIGGKKDLQAVRIFETRLGPVPPPDEPLRVHVGGSVDLARARAVRVSWEWFGKPRRNMPFGWTGSDPESRLDFSPGGRMDRGGSRPSIAVHPPWWTGAGTMWADYRVKMPEEGPIRFEAAGALRDIHPGEPPSDGVIYRAFVAPGDKADEGGDEDEKGKDGQGGEPPADGRFQLLVEKHIAAQTWTPFGADLSRFAGRAVWLRLETHPGPKRDTTCDGAFWGAPRIVSGPLRETPKDGDRVIDRKEMPRFKDARGSMGGYASAVIRETADGRRSFRISLVRDSMDSYGIEFRGETEGEVPLDWDVDFRGPVIVVKFRSKGRIVDLAARLRHVGRVYAGFGNVIDLPASRATLGGGGEKLTTRHVGFDVGFDAWRRRHPLALALSPGTRWSILVAVDFPPDRLELGLGEDAGAAELHTHGEATFTIVPIRRADGEATAIWHAARAYRDAVPMEPGRGVKSLGGRIVFDRWGGRYADAARAVERAAALGVGPAVLVWHNWQRWGYDYRLPDIVPPNPEFGTLEDFRDLARVCRENDVLFAPHDNYIDFYPDAEGYDLEEICFDDGGRPVRAWLNEGRKAQSYRFRPDRAMPHVERNLAWIRREIAPTAYFIDVFASIGAFDFHDSAGGFHPATETVARWKEIHERCREILGGAPQISEDGNDWMIGSVDGGQGNFQRVGKPGPGRDGPWTVWNVECADAERIPWFDAVHHDRMVLHGAGYGSRYAGGESPRDHGVDSDDYAATEVLTGHPPMLEEIDSPAAIRKAWLLGPIGRALAGKRVEDVEFVGGDIHRQKLTWEGGIAVHVNRGRDDWTVEGRVLPPYGFLVKGEAIEAFREKGRAMAKEPGSTYFEEDGFRYKIEEPPSGPRRVIPLPGSAAPPPGAKTGE